MDIINENELKRKNIEVDALADNEGAIRVGEELFVELCLAWIETHGKDILEDLLLDRIESKKPKLKREDGFDFTTKNGIDTSFRFV